MITKDDLVDAMMAERAANKHYAQVALDDSGDVEREHRAATAWEQAAQERDRLADLYIAEQRGDISWLSQPSDDPWAQA